MAAPDLESPPPSFHIPPPPSTPTLERRRDTPSYLRPFTFHRLAFVLYIAGFVAGLFYLQAAIWPEQDPEKAERIPLWVRSPWLGLIWLVAAPGILLALIGNFMYHDDPKLDDAEFVNYPVAWRIVSRGTNEEVLISTIRRIQKEMAATPLFPYLIEVVTDADVFQAPDDVDILHVRVPPDFTTEKGTKFKARALHYASQYSKVGPETWIMHLDEETQPTSSAIKGMAKYIAKREKSGQTKIIGQGMILYHRSWEEHPYLTLADMRRTGDDFGHYYLQHSIGFTLFGLHGAYILCKQEIETDIGFDLGESGSITEDAWWVLIAMQRGIRTSWVDGYLEEQSTQSVMDFLKQRRRWYYGLRKVVTKCPVPVQYRAIIGYNTLTWLLTPALLPFQLGYMILLWSFDANVTLPIRLITNVMFAASTHTYIVGLITNLREHGVKWYMWPVWIVAMMLAWVPVQFMEVSAVVMAFFAGLTENGRGFHIVDKTSKKDSDGKDSNSEYDGEASPSTEESDGAEQ